MHNKHSTYMALLTLVDQISNALENGNSVIGIFLDFSKAFDTVDHEIILMKLEYYGIRGVPLQWLTNYIQGRQQFVTFNGVKSEKSVTKCGVPQGSILGPLLFLIYIDDLASVLDSSLPILFADDTNLFEIGNNFQEMSKKKPTELENIVDWLRANKLSINIIKAQFIILSNKKNIDNLNISINGIQLDQVYVSIFLGVQIDSKLNWKSRIDYIGKTLSK